MRHTRKFRLYTDQEWRTAALLFVSYLVAFETVAFFLPPSAMLFPASAIALTALFFGGRRLWPVVFLAALLAAARNGHGLLSPSHVSIIIFPIAETLQAVIGAHFLRKLRIDPLFRRYRDTFYFMFIALCVSLVVPTVWTLSHIALELPISSLAWWRACIGMATSLLVLAPFLLRWFGKVRMGKRTRSEIVETVGIFALLLAIDIGMFSYGVLAVFEVPLSYLMLIPFFWIALRLRPRFVSLAVLLTAGFAIAATLSGDPATLAVRMYNLEIYLIALSMSFYTIVSLEEDRRVNTNMLRHQLSALENAVSHITAQSNAKNDFIAILAHELRNPLAPVMSGIDLLKLKHERDPEEQETLAIMEDRMDTIRRLLDDLLDISRISEGKISLKREPLDLEQVIRRAVISTEHYLKERHQSLTLHFPKRQKFVLGDPVRLEQVFSNLIGNASKYSHSGDTLSLSMQRDGEMIEVTISDHGVGIDPAHLDAIFTPFHQAEEGGRSKKGLGIGLALVRSFVEMHQGTVSARSDGKGKGSTFVVRLPLHAVVEEPKRDEPAPLEDAASRPGLSVLVVDDNDAAAAGIGRLLELRGCRVRYAYDGGHALEEAMSGNPEVILLDVGLPDQDGYMVAKTLRGRGYQGRLIALTGFSTEDAKEKGAAAGFDHYLVKPAGFADLKRVIPEIA